MMILIPEWFLYLIMLAPAGVVLAILGIILIKSPKQAKTLIKAWLRKRGTIVVSRGNNLLDIVAPKITKTGHLEVSKHEIYGPLGGHNPIITTPYFWAKTGIPVVIADGRKAIYASPDTLSAIHAVEAKLKGHEIPEGVKQWADQLKITERLQELVYPKGEDGKPDKTKEPLGIAIKERVVKLMSMSIRRLRDYFEDAIDVDAEDVLYDMAFQDGVDSAGKQWLMKGLTVLLALGGFGVLLIGIVFIARLLGLA